MPAAWKRAKQLAGRCTWHPRAWFSRIPRAISAGRSGEIIFVGFDAIDDAVAAVEAGQLAATIAQQPSEMGRLGVEFAVLHLNGESLESYVPVDLALVTP